ncbi:uncharacterized protein BCR38DRAFT_439283 [Pseudomassariella vexata]|uniref:CNNM transmembrane domain-containing protein n=1 Tax=Pseudomassariella vexata TaxID=1141098 RepID=A0A1Y2DTK9_9PEZI|nr:uncharacterized protein BCR38DRAFT_439283 [Pseudomassariella vexata]ORY62622.1 hypothetical protein BCR38DRAFT_439283 [Pseudomassariella vexata]
MHRKSGSNVFRTVRPVVLGLAKVAALSISAVTASPIYRSRDVHDNEPEAEGGTLWIYYVVSMVLVLLGGAFAGLTIALMGQDGTYLRVMAQDPEEPQRKNAKRVHDLLKRGKHWVLVTLLLSNVIVNETLPVVLDRCFGGGVAAVVGSTVLIVIFGEVIPQSLCVRYGLQIGGYMSKPVVVLMYLMAPAAWPTAKLLDWLLGEDHGTVYKKSGLKTLVTLHKNLGEVSERLTHDEVTIITAVLDLKRKSVEEVMTPLEDVYIMSEDTVLDEKTIDQILDAGYSRIPIHQSGNPNNFIGMLLVKILITYDPEDGKKVGEFALATLPETRPETSCLDIINFFQEGKSHMVLISEYPGEDNGAIGVVTLEDVIEELIGEEIIDESDVYVDVHKAIRRTHPAPKAHRTQRKDIMVKDMAVKDRNLIDLEGEHDDQSKLTLPLGKIESPAALSSSPKTTLLMRRSSAGQDGQMIHTTVPVKANYQEMKGHLKHLGPSNPASNPKATRVSAVKIKPGQARANSVAGDIIPEHAAAFSDGIADADGVDERTSLLRPQRSGRDGIQALHQSYIATPSASLQDVDGPKPKIAINTENSPAAQADANTESEQSSSSPTAVSASGSIGSQSSGKVPGRRTSTRGYVRSGSITENVVEAGGIRKVVLEATSSGDEGEDDTTNRAPGQSRSRSGTTILLAPTQEEEDQEGSAGPSVVSADGTSDAAKGLKKKSKKKKKKGGK